MKRSTRVAVSTGLTWNIARRNRVIFGDTAEPLGLNFDCGELQ